mmetsp:Transcript_41958/g.98878  ORF Transcript_41958/g.98878 Transcript_41958/m.98878 type:complete len:257 (+) Transcript_41958:296-1066(+)
MMRWREWCTRRTRAPVPSGTCGWSGGRGRRNATISEPSSNPPKTSHPSSNLLSPSSNYSPSEAPPRRKMSRLLVQPRLSRPFRPQRTCFGRSTSVLSRSGCGSWRESWRRRGRRGKRLRAKSCAWTPTTRGVKRHGGSIKRRCKNRQMRRPWRCKSRKTRHRARSRRRMRRSKTSRWSWRRFALCNQSWKRRQNTGGQPPPSACTTKLEQPPSGNTPSTTPMGSTPRVGAARAKMRTFAQAPHRAVIRTAFRMRMA